VGDGGIGKEGRERRGGEREGWEKGGKERKGCFPLAPKPKTETPPMYVLKGCQSRDPESRTVLQSRNPGITIV